MKTGEALKLFNFKAGKDVTEENARERWTELSRKHHPDMGGSTEMMALINDAYDTLKRAIKDEFISKIDPVDYDLEALFKEVLHNIRGLSGIKIEVCGSWLWISGDTKEHRQTLKQAGCRWSKNKAMWSWHHPEQKKSRKRSTWNIDKIRETYGSQEIESSQQRLIA